MLADSAHANPDLAPTAPVAAAVGYEGHRGPVDLDVGLHSHLHDCFVVDCRGDELVAGGLDHLSGQHDRARAHDLECPRRHQVRHPVSDLLPGVVWDLRCECAALLRALVACGWFGIQTWIGGGAIYQIVAIYIPAWRELALIPGLGINGAQLVCFLAFWAVNMIVIWMGIDSIRVLLNIKAPLLIVLGLALLAWAYRQAHGFGPMLAQSSRFDAGQPRAGQFWTFFFPALTAMIGFWATLSLNIPDFTRYARSQRDQILGQAIGLPTTMALYSFIGVAVTSATVTIYGHAIWDPVEVLSKFRDPFVLSIGMVSLCLATLATNIAANVVGPANDFSHLWPRRISFRTGGLITGVLGILIQPWKLIADPTGYIYTWLIAYSSLLGAVGGILIADYFIIRRTRLDLAGLYSRRGPYWYVRGFNPLAMIALAIGIGPCVPGFLGTIGVREVAPFWISLYHYAWFIGFGFSAVWYLVLMVIAGPQPAAENSVSIQNG